MSDHTMSLAVTIYIPDHLSSVVKRYISSSKGRTQGDPLIMAISAIGLTPLVAYSPMI